MLLAHAASATVTTGSGSGGVLPNHSPLIIAEQFGILEALHDDTLITAATEAREVESFGGTGHR